MNWLRQLFRRRQIYRDLFEEIQQHLAEKVDELIAGGMSRKDDEYAARREFGNVARMIRVSVSSKTAPSTWCSSSSRAKA